MNINGIGLGLMIAKQIVEKFDGAISFTSEKGKGSCFLFKFKLNEIRLPKESSVFKNDKILSSESDYSEDSYKSCKIKKMKRISDMALNILDSYGGNDFYQPAISRKSSIFLE